MKKILLLSLILLSFCFIPSAGAEEGKIMVTVSEDLTPIIDWECKEKDGYYECPVEKWFGSVQSMLGYMIRYATFLIGLVWVLFIVINGIMYSIGWEDKAGIKDRIIKSVGGLLLLLLSWVVLNAIAPWIYTI